MNNTVSQADFWNLPEVKHQQEIQKRNPYNSPEHRNAFNEIKRILTTLKGKQFAQDHMGNYDD